MTFFDLMDHYEERENSSFAYDNGCALNALGEYVQKRVETSVPPYKNTGNFIEDLLNNYFNDKGTVNEALITKILDSYSFNYAKSIYNSMFYLLGKSEEIDFDISPLSWPGINAITNNGPLYRLATKVGNIEVYRASEIFTEPSAKCVFAKPLMQRCYDRAYDFLKVNRDYQAVISYMPNFFLGGYYHVYLEKGEETLDISANSYYPSKKYSGKVLNGEVINKISFDQLEEDYSKVKKEIPEFTEDYTKLHILALYYDFKNKTK